MRWAEASQPYLLALGILLGFGGMIWGLTVPPDEEMQELIKPLFVHVPSAGLSLIVYGSMSIAAFVALVWRHPLPEIFCLDRKSTRLNSSHSQQSRMPSSA